MMIISGRMILWVIWGHLWHLAVRKMQKVMA